MKTLIARQFSPAEMEEIRKDLFRAKGNASITPRRTKSGTTP